METLDNPPAFPRDERYLGHNGMTLRDYFAAQAMPVVVVATLGRFAQKANKIAQESYIIADAMLAERAKGSTGGGE